MGQNGSAGPPAIENPSSPNRPQASVTTAGLILKNLQGRTGLVLLNVWDPSFEPYLTGWGRGLPAGTITQPQAEIGRIQGRQLSAALPAGANVLVVTGPPRSSAARERLEGLRSTVRPDVTLHTTAANQWSETDGILAFNSWYGVFKSRREEIHAIAGQSDDLAVGASKAGGAVANPDHARMFGRSSCSIRGGEAASPCTTGSSSIPVMGGSSRPLSNT